MPISQRPVLFAVSSALPAALVLAGLYQIAWLIFQWGSAAQRVWYDDIPFLVVIYLSATLAFSAWRAAHPEQRPALKLLLFALLSMSVAESIWMYFELFLGTSPEVSLADPFYVLFYVFLGWTLLRLARIQLRSLTMLGLMLDSTILVGVVGIFAWYGFLSSLADDPSVPVLVRAVWLAYPALDFLGLALILLTLRSTKLTARNVLFGLGLLAYITADLVYADLNKGGSYQIGSFIDGFWTWGTAAVALAGWSARRTPGETGPPPQTPWLLRHSLMVLPYFAVLSTCLLLLMSANEQTLASRGVVVGTVLLFLVVMLRQTLAFLENSRLTEHLRATAQQLEASSQELLHRAFHDPLTGLPNRALFEERLQQAMSAAQHAEHEVGVLYVDLDGFKHINDTLGHAAGDTLLRQAAQRMQRVLRAEDTLARMGGDEFTVILTALSGARQAEEIAGRVLILLRHPFELGSKQVSVTASIGLSLYTHSGEEPALLQRQADLAMYQAKLSGKNAIRIFGHGTDLAAAHRNVLKKV